MTTNAEALAQAIACHQAGQFAHAEAIYRSILQTDPCHVDALQLCGMVAYHTGRAELAATFLREALRHKPDFAEVHNNLANILAAQGKLDEAKTHYWQAIRLKPHFAEGHFNLGQSLRRLGEWAEAARSLQEAIRLQPDYAEAHCNLGNILRNLGRPEDAAGCYRAAIRFKPDYAEAHNNLGSALYDLGQREKAAESFGEAIRLKPDYVEAHNNLAIAWRDLGRMNEAATCLGEALRLKPDFVEAHFNLGLTYLQLGNYEQGWHEYEWRWRTTDLVMSPLISSRPVWDGAPLAGKTILLHAEQGFGDTLQFVRYAVRVRERGGRVLLECPAALAPLLSRCAGVERLFSSGDALAPFDVHAPLLSLPRLLGTTSVERIPADSPYLNADPELAARWAARLTALRGFRVGIVWQGNPRPWDYRFRAADRRRSFPLAHFEALARVPGVHLVSLQKGFGTEQLSQVADRFAVTDLGDMLNDFMDAAAVMKNLDLVISADTAPAHLAGALGVPVWVPLAFASCWRWLLHREDSPWYPSMRLFRQKQAGNWDEVFERIRNELEQKLKKMTGEGRSGS